MPALIAAVELAVMCATLYELQRVFTVWCYTRRCEPPFSECTMVHGGQVLPPLPFGWFCVWCGKEFGGGG